MKGKKGFVLTLGIAIVIAVLIVVAGLVIYPIRRIIRRRSKAKTISLSMGSIFIRYLLLAVPLVAAIKYEQFNLVATILGIFMIQLVILAEHVLTLIPAMRKKQI